MIMNENCNNSNNNDNNDNNALLNIVRDKKKLIFIGSAGSGKTEIASNFAIGLSQNQNLPVHFFDVDQTKSAFRARDIKDEMSDNGVIFHQPEEFLDSMVVPHGLKEALMDMETMTVIDAGGNEKGTKMLAHLEEYIKPENSIVFLVINCYRPFFENEIAARAEIESISEALGETEFKVIANPNFGAVTTESEIKDGLRMIIELLGENKDRISALIYMSDLKINPMDFADMNVLGIKLFQENYMQSK